MGLVVVAIVTTAIISILGKPIGDQPSIIISPGLVTPEDTDSATLGTSATQTAAFLTTQKAIVIASDSAITRTPFIPSIIPPTGIYEDERTKYMGIVFEMQVQNSWFGIVSGYSVSIYAGALMNDQNQGAIYFIMMLPRKNFEERILIPGKHGTVRVIDEHNNRLTLTAADGETFYFDVPARQFVSALTEIIPTATLPLSYAPYVSTPSLTISASSPYP